MFPLEMFLGRLLQTRPARKSTSVIPRQKIFGGHFLPKMASAVPYPPQGPWKIDMFVFAEVKRLIHGLFQSYLQGVDGGKSWSQAVAFDFPTGRHRQIWAAAGHLRSAALPHVQGQRNKAGMEPHSPNFSQLLHFSIRVSR